MWVTVCGSTWMMDDVGDSVWVNLDDGRCGSVWVNLNDGRCGSVWVNLDDGDVGDSVWVNRWVNLDHSQTSDYIPST